jgi:hypothetical protein
VVGSAWAERLRRGRFTAASSSPAFGRSGSGVLGSGVGETAKEQGERFAGVLVVLVRAKDRALRCCSEPFTAVVRWWPAVVFWARGTGLEALTRGVEGVTP